MMSTPKSKGKLLKCPKDQLALFTLGLRQLISFINERESLSFLSFHWFTGFFSFPFYPPSDLRYSLMSSFPMSEESESNITVPGRGSNIIRTAWPHFLCVYKWLSPFNGVLMGDSNLRIFFNALIVTCLKRGIQKSESWGRCDLLVSVGTFICGSSLRDEDGAAADVLQPHRLAAPHQVLQHQQQGHRPTWEYERTSPICYTYWPRSIAVSVCSSGGL